MFKSTLSFSTAALLAMTGGTAHAADAYTGGHSDIGVHFHDDGDGPEFELHWHIEGQAAIGGVTSIYGEGSGELEPEFEADELFAVIDITPNSYFENFNYPSFLGGGTGEFWYISQSNPNTLDVPWVGFGSEELDPTNWDSPITFALTGFSGPGEFALWQSDPFGSPVVKWDPIDGLADDAFDAAVGGHDHYVFGFTALGTYDLEITASGSYLGPDGLGPAENVSSTETFTFVVVPEPASLALLAAGGVVGLARRRRA